MTFPARFKCGALAAIASRARGAARIAGAAVLPVVAALLLGAAPAEESVTYRYHSIDEETGAVVGESSRLVRRFSDDRIEVLLAWKSFADSTSGTQRYLVDNEYATLEWSVQSPGQNTDYSGWREENVLVVRGTLRGEVVDESIEIDDKPFYLNPSFNLQSFARSGREKLEFRTLRPDKLSEHKMKVKVEERTTIEIQGKEYSAVRLKWGLTGFKSYFFNQNLWFRESDGVFLRAEPRDGVYAEFVSQEATSDGPAEADESNEGEPPE